MFFVGSALLHQSAVKLIILILAVNFPITAGDQVNTKCVVAGLLLQRTGAETQFFHLCPPRITSQVIGDLPIVVAKNKAGELGLARGRHFHTCPQKDLKLQVWLL